MAVAAKIPASPGYDPASLAQGICVEVADGVWAIEYSDVAVTGDPPIRISAKWQIVRSRASGERSTTSPAPLDVGPGSGQWARLEPAIDYDEDGQEEVLFRTGADAGGRSESRGTLMTALASLVTPYGPAEGLDVARLADVDGDERPDILTEGPYTRPSDPACEVPPAEPIYLAAHAESVGFSLSDEVAVAYARRQCPEPPTSLDLDPRAAGSLARLRCARLWGVSEADALGAIRQVCAPEELSGSGCEGLSEGCRRQRELIRWTKATPPLRIGEPWTLRPLAPR